MATADKTVHIDLLRIIDGDTVVVKQRGGFLWIFGHKQERIRLWGIDAPESAQVNGEQATKHLVRITKGKNKIWMTRKGIDQYGRTIAVIHPNNVDDFDSYNLRMVEDGHAHTYMLSGNHANAYRQAQSAARADRRGIWKGDPEHPRHFRARDKKSAKFAANLKVALILAGAAAVAVLIILNLDRLPG